MAEKVVVGMAEEVVAGSFLVVEEAGSFSVIEVEANVRCHCWDDLDIPHCLLVHDCRDLYRLLCLYLYRLGLHGHAL